MSESQTALIFNLKFANINFPRVRKRSRMEKFELFRRTEIIQKWGFQDNKNSSSLLIFDGNI